MLLEGETTYGVVAARLSAFLLQHTKRLEEMAAKDQLLAATYQAREKNGGMLFSCLDSSTVDHVCCI